MSQGVGHGGSPGAGGGAQPVEQPGCAVEGLGGAGAEVPAAERADGAVVRGTGEADFDGAEKVLGQERATGPGGGAVPAPRHGSTDEGEAGEFPEGQGTRRADGAAVPQGGASNNDPQDDIVQDGSLGLGLRQRGAASAPKPPSDTRKVGKAVAEYCLHRDVLDKTCTEAIAEHFGCTARSVRRGASSLSATPGVLQDLAASGATERGEHGLPPYLRPYVLPACKAQVLPLSDRAAPVKKGKRKRQEAISAEAQALRLDVQQQMAAGTLSSVDGSALLQAAGVKISSSALCLQHTRQPGAA